MIQDALGGAQLKELESILLKIRTLSGLLTLAADHAPAEFAGAGQILLEQAEAGLDLLDPLKESQAS